MSGPSGVVVGACFPEADAKRDQLKIRLGAGGCVRMEEEKRGSGGREVLLRQPRKTDYSELFVIALRLMILVDV